MEALNDDSPFPFGKYKGEKTANVPAKYLLWLYEQPDFLQSRLPEYKQVRRYIEDNLTVLNQEVKRWPR